MSPSGARFIPAREAETIQLEAFPYLSAHYAQTPEPQVGMDDETPVGQLLTSPEEDADRLVSTDELIHRRLQAAEHRTQEIERAAYEKGFEAGQAEGRNYGESLYKVFASRLEKHLEELARTTDLLDKAAKDEILALALAVGEFLAGQQIEYSRESIRTLLDRVLEQHPFPSLTGTTGRGTLDVFLHPKDLEQLGDRYVGVGSVRLLEDPNLSRGGLRLSAPEGVLEATLERRRERLLELMHRFREQRWA